MDKEEVIINSVKKLIALDLSDEEIVENLRDVGIDEAKAKRIISQARGQPIQPEEKKTVKSDSGTVLRRVAEDLAETIPELPSAPKPESTLSKLWERGIITTVNQRLNEMKQLKREIDQEIEERTRAVAESEVKKIEALIESKATLMSARASSDLEAKQSEVEQTINLKIGELKAISAKLDSKLDQMQRETGNRSEALEELKMQISQLKQSKEEIVSRMNQQLDGSKAKMETVMQETESKMHELDERVSKTLELEQEVIDGILDEAKHNIKEMGSDVREDMKPQISGELKKFEELKTYYSPEKLKERVKEISDHRGEIKKAVLADLEKQLEKKQKAMIDPVLEKIKEMDGIRKAIEKENSKTDELKKIQSQIMEKMHNDVESTKKEVEDFLVEGEGRLKEMGKQVTETSALQDQLNETLASIPDKETITGIQKQMTEMNAEKEEIIRVKQEMQDMLEKSSIGGVKIKGLAELEDKIVQRYDAMIQQRLKNRESEFLQIVEAKAKELQGLKGTLSQEIKAEANLPKIKSQMEELEIFKEQFINVIDRNVEKFNEKIKKFNESTTLMDELFKKRLEAMDRKLEELDKFEKTFAREMGLMIDKLTGEK